MDQRDVVAIVIGWIAGGIIGIVFGLSWWIPAVAIMVAVMAWPMCHSFRQ